MTVSSLTDGTVCYLSRPRLPPDYNGSVATVFLREGRRLVLRLFGVLGTRAVIAVCLFVAVSVSVGAWRHLWTAARASAADGTVIRQIETLSVDWDSARPGPTAGVQMAPASRTFRAVVGFTAGGKTYEVTSARQSAVQLYPTGSSVRVAYPNDHPERAWIQAEAPDAWAQAGLLLMGTIVAAGAVQWWWWLAKRRPRFRRRARATEAAPVAVPAESPAPSEGGAPQPQS